MSSDISSMLNSTIRFSGLSSGLDTDLIIEQLMSAERSKVDKVKQQKQVLEWKRDDYREIVNKIRVYKDEYFDVLNPSTNFRSTSAFASFDVSSDDESIVTATAGASAVDTSHSITVRSLATQAKLQGQSPVTGAVKGSNDILNLTLQGTQISIDLDGVTKSIDLENYSDMTDLETKLENSLDTSFGAGKFDIVVTGNKIEVQSLLAGSTFSITGATDLGFAATDNTSNRISLNTALDDIEAHFTNSVNLDAATNVDFIINGVSIDLGKTFADATIDDVMSAINSSDAGVEMTYDSLNDSFALVTKDTGANKTITYTDVNGLFTSLGIAGGVLTNGEDAEFDLDGVANMKRSSNDFTVDGVEYSLKKADPLTTIEVGVSRNVDDLFDKIVGFVGKYNDLLGKLNGEVTEKRDRSYTPLTEDQKSSMSEDDIKLWEGKAKAGMLYGDSIVNNIISSLRNALTDTVSGVDMSLSEIGITTGSYDTRGQLVIDETKLKAALTDKADIVTDLFTKDSQYSYSDALNDPAKRSTRYSESGLAERIYDIMQDNIRTTRDSNGYKGMLLEKAGISGDITEFNNFLNDSIEEKDKMIDNLLSKLVTKENMLYARFTAMERALSQMNNQSSWLGQQMGG